MPRTWAGLAGFVLIAGALAWALFVGLPRWYQGRDASGPPAREAEGPAAGTDVPQIQATLYYVSADGLGLVAVEREVPYGEDTSAQARRILERQLDPAPQPLTNAIPAGTRLRHLFVTAQGQAFVDLSADVALEHSGGSLDELFTVYTIVNVLTTNLPAITAVQILIDGREADTLAGHVDLRNPLQQNLRWVVTDEEPSAPGEPREAEL